LNRIKELRLKRNLTLKELSTETGISVSSLSAYERGDRSPKIEALETLAKTFDVPLFYLDGSAGRDGQIREVAPYLTLNDDGTIALDLPDDFQKEIQKTYNEIPEPAQFGFDVFNDVWKNVDEFAFKVPPYIKDAVNLYFLKLLSRANYTDQTGNDPTHEHNSLN